MISKERGHRGSRLAASDIFRWQICSETVLLRSYTAQKCGSPKRHGGTVAYYKVSEIQRSDKGFSFDLLNAEKCCSVSADRQ